MRKNTPMAEIQISSKVYFICLDLTSFVDQINQMPSKNCSLLVVNVSKIWNPRDLFYSTFDSCESIMDNNNKNKKKSCAIQM